MTISIELTNDERQLIAWLRDAERSTVRHLFRRLAPPPIEQFCGEFDAELLSQGGPATTFVTRLVFGLHGPWIGKAFQPLNEETGVGYNCFSKHGKVSRKLPMDTRIGQSTLDDGQSLFIRYDSQNRGVIRWLTGEVRRVGPRILLGIGAFGPKIGPRDAWRRRIPFLLAGPSRPFHQPVKLQQAA